MIERVARALCRADGHPENIRFEGKPMWASYVETARAVVAAMREPTEAMVGDAQIDVVVLESGDDEYIRLDATEATRAWNTMIDAALAEGESTA